MKLYATVTSERASKSQGGNVMLESKITINLKEVLTVDIDERENGTKPRTHYCLQVRDENGFIVFERDYPIETKGKKKKDECYSMVHKDDIQEYGYCLECQRTK